MEIIFSGNWYFIFEFLIDREQLFFINFAFFFLHSKRRLQRRFTIGAKGESIRTAYKEKSIMVQIE